jgi:hypothetical protein
MKTVRMITLPFLQLYTHLPYYQRDGVSDLGLSIDPVRKYYESRHSGLDRNPAHVQQQRALNVT